MHPPLYYVFCNVILLHSKSSSKLFIIAIIYDDYGFTTHLLISFSKVSNIFTASLIMIDFCPLTAR